MNSEALALGDGQAEQLAGLAELARREVIEGRADQAADGLTDAIEAASRTGLAERLR